MGFIYDRKETKDEIIIIYKRYPIFSIGVWVVIAICLFFDKWVPYLFQISILIALIVLIINIWKPNQEIKRAMKKGSVQFSGSKWSFSNPLTARIKKK